MSARGHCYDNAPVESFFALLKRERIRRRTYATREQAKADVFDYIEVFYNRRRRARVPGLSQPRGVRESNHEGLINWSGILGPNQFPAV